MIQENTVLTIRPTTLSGLDQDEKCPLGCKAKHLVSACPMYQKSTVDEKWEIVKQNNRCRKCLRVHHTNSCKIPDGTTCDKCTRRHHRSLHNERVPLAYSEQATETLLSANESQEASNHNVQDKTSVPAICPVQKVKTRGQSGYFTEALTMLDSGSNTSFISKNVVKKLGIREPKTHLTMNLTGGQKKLEASEFLDMTVVSNTEPSIQKSVRAYAINKPCSPTRTVSRTTLESYPHLKAISNDLHLSGGTVDFLIGTDFAEAYNDMHVIAGKCGEPIAKENCFGSGYVMGTFDSNQGEQPSAINSIDVGTVDVIQDMKKTPYTRHVGSKTN